MGLFNRLKKQSTTSDNLKTLKQKQDIEKQQANRYIQMQDQAATFLKEGKTDDAIHIYEQMVSEGFDGSNPYTTLCSIYHKQKRYSDEQRIAKSYLTIAAAHGWTSDKIPKLKRFEEIVNRGIK